MNKIQAVMELYESVFPEYQDLLEQAGTWIKIYDGDGSTPSSSYRTTDLLEEIYMQTGKSYEWDDAYGILRVEYERDYFQEMKEREAREELWSTEPEAREELWSTEPEPDYENALENAGYLAPKETIHIEEEAGLFDDIGEV